MNEGYVQQTVGPGNRKGGCALIVINSEIEIKYQYVCLFKFRAGIPAPQITDSSFRLTSRDVQLVCLSVGPDHPPLKSRIAVNEIEKASKHAKETEEN